jgi:hypothetical protein
MKEVSERKNTLFIEKCASLGLHYIYEFLHFLELSYLHGCSAHTTFSFHNIIPYILYYICLKNFYRFRFYIVEKNDFFLLKTFTNGRTKFSYFRWFYYNINFLVYIIIRISNFVCFCRPIRSIKNYNRGLRTTSTFSWKQKYSGPTKDRRLRAWKPFGRGSSNRSDKRNTAMILFISGSMKFRKKNK